LESERRMCVSQIVEADSRKTGRADQPIEPLRDMIGMQGVPIFLSEYKACVAPC
jgi:hypothetical protein